MSGLTYQDVADMGVAGAHAEIVRLRNALETIADGACDARYGPGCDTRCKEVAWKALQLCGVENKKGTTE